MVSIRQASLCAELGVRCGAASGGARRSGPPPAGASGPRVRLRAEGAPWCSGPAPAARAAPRPFLAAVRDLQGNRRCSCPGGAGSRGPRGRGGRSPRAAAASAPPRAPPPRWDSSLLRTGTGAGGLRAPHPSPPAAGRPLRPLAGPPAWPGGRAALRGPRRKPRGPAEPEPRGHCAPRRGPGPASAREGCGPRAECSAGLARGNGARPALGPAGLRPRWWEQDGCDCLGLQYSTWKKREKVVQYFSCQGYYSTQNKKKEKRAGGKRADPPPPGPGVGAPGAAAHVGFWLAFILEAAPA